MSNELHINPSTKILFSEDEELRNGEIVSVAAFDIYDDLLKRIPDDLVELAINKRDIEDEIEDDFVCYNYSDCNISKVLSVDEITTQNMDLNSINRLTTYNKDEDTLTFIPIFKITKSDKFTNENKEFFMSEQDLLNFIEKGNLYAKGVAKCTIAVTDAEVYKDDWDDFRQDYCEKLVKEDLFFDSEYVFNKGLDEFIADYFKERHDVEFKDCDINRIVQLNPIPKFDELWKNEEVLER